MRLLFGLSVIFLTTFLATNRDAHCGDPVDVPSKLSRVRDAVMSGNTSSAVNELRSLPNQERLEWLSQLHQYGGNENPNGGGSMADYSALIGLIENVIDADWQVNGGTASLNPYRQGCGSTRRV